MIFAGGGTSDLRRQGARFRRPFFGDTKVSDGDATSATVGADLVIVDEDVRRTGTQRLSPHTSRHGVRSGVVDDFSLHRRPSRHGQAARAKTARRRPLRRLAGIDKLRYPLPGLPGEAGIEQITTAVRQVPGVGLIGLDLANRSVVVTGHRLDGAAVRAAIAGVANGSPPLSAGVELFLVLGLELLRPPPAPESR